jgi:hypothetical protein
LKENYLEEENEESLNLVNEIIENKFEISIIKNYQLKIESKIYKSILNFSSML